MLQITGRVVNTFTQEGGKNKDGEEYEARHKVQLMGQVGLPNGEIKVDMIDLTVDDLDLWKSYKDKLITIEVGAFAPAKGNIIYFVKKGSKPVAGLMTDKGA